MTTPTPLTAKTLDRLEALLAKATPGLCDICRKPRTLHDSGAGIPICPAIYAPGYRSTLNDALLAAARERDVLREALEEAATVFEDYERMHRAKGTPDGDRKAARNGEHGWRIRFVLAGQQS